jgi:hypothetical protein
MSTVATEIVQEADVVNPLFAALDSPQDVDVDVTAGVDVDQVTVEDNTGTTASTEQTGLAVKTEQVATPDADQTQEPQSEIVQLRQLLRSQKVELEVLKNTVSRHDQVQKGDIGDDVPLSDLEQLQNDIAELSSARGSEITNLLEMMELTPKYEDVRAVCTRQNFDDILELASVEVAKAKGINETVALLELEKEVWAQGNPYRYMYELIKTYHPRFTVKTDTPAVVNDTTKPVPVAHKAPVSIASIAGGDGGITEGWTSSKIDALAESDLGKVPADIYEKYLQGTLA